MIQFLIGWLWDFNHKHEWVLKDKTVKHVDVMGLTCDSDVVIYSCKCGAISKPGL